MPASSMMFEGDALEDYSEATAAGLLVSAACSTAVRTKFRMGLAWSGNTGRAIREHARRIAVSSLQFAWSDEARSGWKAGALSAAVFASMLERQPVTLARSGSPGRPGQCWTRSSATRCASIRARFGRRPVKRRLTAVPAATSRHPSLTARTGRWASRQPVGLR
jgi:hypothetical protein